MNITSEMVEAFHKAYDASLEMQPRETNQAIYDGLSAALQSAADTPAPRTEYHHVGWVHSFPSPRFGVGTFFSQFEPTGNVDWQKAYVRAPLPPSKVREE